MLCSYSLCAQSLELDIVELFKLADQNSLSIAAYSTAELAAKEGVKSAKAQWYPQIQAQASVSYIGNGQIWNREFGDFHTVEMPHFGNNFAVEVTHVIYSGGAITNDIKLASLQHQIAALNTEINRQEIRFLLLGHFLELYKLNNQQQVLQENISITEQVLANMHSRLREGTALQNDLTRYELQLELFELQLTQIIDAKKILNYQLTSTLQLPAATIIIPTEKLAGMQIEDSKQENWHEQAKASNLFVQQAETAVEMNKAVVKLQQSAYIPKIALVAADNLNGPILIEVPVINNNFNYWYVGIGLQYDLSSIYKNNKKVKQAKLNYQAAEIEKLLAEEHIDAAVQSCYVNYTTSLSNYLTQQKSVELANQNYNVISNRYENDLALLTELLDAGNMKLSAELNLVNAHINVIFNHYKMKYITHTL